jgi:hypothetical protein
MPSSASSSPNRNSPTKYSPLSIHVSEGDLPPPLELSPQARPGPSPKVQKARTEKRGGFCCCISTPSVEDSPRGQPRSVQRAATVPSAFGSVLDYELEVKRQKLRDAIDLIDPEGKAPRAKSKALATCVERGGIKTLDDLMTLHVCDEGASESERKAWGALTGAQRDVWNAFRIFGYESGLEANTEFLHAVFEMRALPDGSPARQKAMEDIYKDRLESGGSAEVNIVAERRRVLRAGGEEGVNMAVQSVKNMLNANYNQWNIFLGKADAQAAGPRGASVSTYSFA